MPSPTRRVMFITHEAALLEWDLEDQGEFPKTYTMKRVGLQDMIAKGVAECPTSFLCYRGRDEKVTFEFFRVMRGVDLVNVPVYLERIG